ncbi:MAG: hypothetical protein WC527_04120 [Candidatus Margulisiibacteriota bacterium]
MRKFCAFVVIFALVLSPGAFAAKKFSSSDMKIGIGFDNNFAAMKFFTDTYTGSIGLNFSSTSANNASTTTFGIGGKFAFNLTGGSVPTHAGGGISYFNLGNNASAFQFMALYGAETTIADKLNVGFDIYPVSFTSVSANNANQSTFSLLGGSVYAYFCF